MPITNEEELNSIKRRVLEMLMDTIKTFELLAENSNQFFGENSTQIRSAINECLDDFFRRTDLSGETHPEVLIFEGSRADFQNSGFYGVQLDIKERQVKTANRTLRERLIGGFNSVFRRSFYWWVDVINNFLGSLVSGIGLAEALKELKDCIRDDMPQEEGGVR